MCQLTSPSLKIVFELPSTAGISRTATSSERLTLPLSLSAAAVAIKCSSRPRALRSPAAVDGGKDEADHLRTHEKELRPARQADEQANASENAAEADHPRQRRTNLPLRRPPGARQPQPRGNA